MEKWEYTTIKFETKGTFGGIVDTKSIEYELNKLGEQGWELVSCISSNEACGKSKEIVAVLKKNR